MLHLASSTTSEFGADRVYEVNTVVNEDLRAATLVRRKEERKPTILRRSSGTFTRPEGDASASPRRKVSWAGGLLDVQSSRKTISAAEFSFKTLSASSGGTLRNASCIASMLSYFSLDSCLPAERARLAADDDPVSKMRRSLSSSEPG